MSDTPKWTPGPWLYRPRAPIDDWGMIRAETADGWIVALARAGDGRSGSDFAEDRARGTDPYEANGRLIAAAPDLYEVLHAIITALEDGDLTATAARQVARFSGRNALAKAEGRT